MKIMVPQLKQDEFFDHKNAEDSEAVRSRVCQAHLKQIERQSCKNVSLEAEAIKQYCALDSAGEVLLSKAVTQLKLSARGYDRILKLSRTIADLSNSDAIFVAHLAEAIQYRRLH